MVFVPITQKRDIAVATSDGAKASQEAPPESVFERSICVLSFLTKAIFSKLLLYFMPQTKFWKKL